MVSKVVATTVPWPPAPGPALKERQYCGSLRASWRLIGRVPGSQFQSETSTHTENITIVIINIRLNKCDMVN